MNITAGIVIYSLSLDTTIRTNIEVDQDFEIDSYELWEKGLPQNRVLYIVEKERLLRDLTIWRRKFILCAGWLDEEELEAFLSHVNECPACREELEIYFTVYVGLRQLDTGTGVYDITGALGESMDLSWMKVRAVRLRKVVCYAVNTLVTVSILVMLAMQLRIWIG